MINLRNFVTDINEMAGKKGMHRATKAEMAARRAAKEADMEIKKDGTVEVDGEEVEPTDAEDVIFKKGDSITMHDKTQPFKGVEPGVPADKNGTRGLYAVDAPSKEDMEGWGTDEYRLSIQDNENAVSLAAKFQSEEDFMVVGDAGWAKTDLITSIAHKAGYHVITVYLDKACATDLGGIPVPIKHEETGITYQDFALPAWAAEMLINPNKKYLLFFDEMNQAAPDVMNALMPIVLKHDVCGVHFEDMLVGAAGNYAHENDSVSELNQPLEDRFKPIITWETHTDVTWKSAFDWAHKKYDSIIGKEVIDKTYELRDLWNSPRDITRVIYKWCEKNKDKKCFESPEHILNKRLESCIWRKLPESEKNSRSNKDKLAKFAEWLWKWSQNGGKVEENTRKKKSQKLTEEQKITVAVIKEGLVKGYANMDGEKFLLTPQNAVEFEFGDDRFKMTAEMVNKVIKEIEAEGNTVKFSSIDEGRSYAEEHDWNIVERIDDTVYFNGEVAEDEDGEEVDAYWTDHLKKTLSRRKIVSRSNRSNHTND